MDGKYDCPHGDDEYSTEIDNSLSETEIFDNNEEQQKKRRYVSKNISFQTICDDFTELLPIMINERYETDETECEQWQCINIYTHCNDVWNCPDGSDELGCNLYLPLKCSLNHHLCVSPNTTQLMCLSITNANDGKIDCIGATDEPGICLSKSKLTIKYNFYCTTFAFRYCVRSEDLCNGIGNCYFADDEQFCQKNRTFSQSKSICHPNNFKFGSDVEQFLCNYTYNDTKQQIIYFSLNEIRTLVDDQVKNDENALSPSSPIIHMTDEYQYGCHRGLALDIWLNTKNTLITSTCLCPPSFYGDKCQYQNQRISLSIKFHVSPDSLQIPFAIIVSLIDDTDQRMIHSYEQFTYLSIRDCKIKFHIYLLYSTRPKNTTKSYSIHIDIYEGMS